MLYAMPVFALVLAIALWTFPMSIAHKLVPRTNQSNVLRVPARQATAAAAAILGLWALIGALPHLIGTGGGLMLFGGGSYAITAYFSPDRLVQLIATVARCALGLFLLIKPWWLASKIFPSSTEDGEDA